MVSFKANIRSDDAMHHFESQVGNVTFGTKCITAWPH